MWDGVFELEPVGDEEAVCDGELDPVGDTVDVGVCEGLLVWLGVTEGEGELLGVADGVAETVGVADGVAVGNPSVPAAAGSGQAPAAPVHSGASTLRRWPPCTTSLASGYALNNVFIVADWAPPSLEPDSPALLEKVANGEAAPRRAAVVLTLAEAEALRRALHTKHSSLAGAL